MDPNTTISGPSSFGGHQKQGGSNESLGNKSAAGMQHTPRPDIFNAKKIILKKLVKKCQRQRVKNQFITSIKGHYSVLICRNLPICNPRTLLHNINSHNKFKENRYRNAKDR